MAASNIPDLESMSSEARIPVPAYAARLGFSIRTVQRWLSDPAMEMPKLLYIRGRRYFRAGDLLAWEKKFPDLSGSHKRPTSSAKVKAESKTRVSTITEAVVKAVNEALDEPADHET